MADKEAMSIDELYKTLRNVSGSSGEEFLPEMEKETTSDKESQAVFSLPNLTGEQPKSEEPQGETENQDGLEELASFEQTEKNSTETGENCEQGYCMGFIGENGYDNTCVESVEELEKILEQRNNPRAEEEEYESEKDNKGQENGTHRVENTSTEVVTGEHTEDMSEECPDVHTPIIDREEPDVKDSKKQKLWSINVDGEFLNIYIQEQDVTLRFPVGGEYTIHVGTFTLEIDSKNNVSFYQTDNKNILSVRR